MFELKLRRFVPYENKYLKPVNRVNDRLYSIYKILPIEFQNNIYLALVFDESTIALFHYNSFKHHTEFKVNFEFSIEQFMQNEKHKVTKFNAVSAINKVS